MSSKIKLRKSRKILSILTALVLSVCLTLSVTTQAFAETVANEKVKEVANSVLQVRMLYKPDNESVTLVSSGSCFLINSTTALSCAHIFEFSQKFANYAKQYYGENHKLSEKNIKGYEILVNGGVPVSATLKKVNKKADYSVIKLDETVARPTVTLGHSSDLSVTQQVYTLGYPDEIAKMQDSNTFTNDRITITDSTIANIAVMDGVDKITHNATLAEGNSGGPIVDTEGNVIGINLSETEDQKYFRAASIDQIVALLDDLDIEYTRAGGGVTPTQKNEEPTTAKAASEETVAPTTRAQSGIDKTEPASEPATEPAPLDTTKLIIIIAIAVLLIVVIIVVILIIVSSKKKSAQKLATPPRGTVMPGPGVPQAADPRSSQSPYAQPYNRPAVPQPSATVPSSEGSGETSVLNDGAGETTVLGNNSTGFTMIRKRNNERISINKPEFVIGKERRRVDYCISDNNSISRIHAKVKVRAGRCYIADLGSTNCTYVNGSKLSPNQEVILSRGDQIKISDEEFEFLG